MKQIEYKVIYISKYEDPPYREQELNLLGAEGWDLVSADDNGYHTFKRYLGNVCKVN